MIGVGGRVEELRLKVLTFSNHKVGFPGNKPSSIEAFHKLRCHSCFVMNNWKIPVSSYCSWLVSRTGKPMIVLEFEPELFERQKVMVIL